MINFAPDVCRNADILFDPQCGRPSSLNFSFVSPASDTATPIGWRRIPPERAFITADTAVDYSRRRRRGRLQLSGKGL
jgi:hypothetical protein